MVSFYNLFMFNKIFKLSIILCTNYQLIVDCVFAIFIYRYSVNNHVNLFKQKHDVIVPIEIFDVTMMHMMIKVRLVSYFLIFKIIQ